MYKVRVILIFRFYGKNLTDYDGLLKLLGSFPQGNIKKANVFRASEIEDFLSDPTLSQPYWIVRKVIAIVMYYGGLRLREGVEVSIVVFVLY